MNSLKTIWYGYIKRIPWIIKRNIVWFTRSKQCVYCKRTLNRSKYTIDHYTPKSKGGSNKLSNLVLACARCNRKKADRMPTGDVLNSLKIR